MLLDMGLPTLNPIFSAPQVSELNSAHQQEDFQRISKLILLLFLVPIL